MSTLTRTIEHRIHRLETQNRLLMAGLLLLLASLLVAATGKDEVPDLVKARAFHVVAEDGAPVVQLFAVSNKGVSAGKIQTHFSTKRERDYGNLVTLGYLERRGVVLVSGSKGPGAVLSADSDGNGALAVYGGEPNQRRNIVDINSRKDGPGAVAVYDPRGIEGADFLTTKR